MESPVQAVFGRFGSSVCSDGGPLPFAPRREEGAGDGESGPGLARIVRPPSFRSATRGRGRGWRVCARLGSDCSAPFLPLRREEGAGDGESAPGLARIVRSPSLRRDEGVGDGESASGLARIVRPPCLRRPAAKGRGRGWRVCFGLSSNCSAPFLSLRREEGAGDGESGLGLVRPQDPFSLRQEEGVGDGESAPGLARIVRPLPFAPARGRGRGWRVRPRLLFASLALGEHPSRLVHLSEVCTRWRV
jgi:hypothetical protein